MAQFLLKYEDVSRYANAVPMGTTSTDVERSDDALVFVVDDDPAAAQLIARWLDAAGFQPEIHASAESLLQAFSCSLPDAVCLDLGLPGMSGQDALRLIRRRHRTVPVIVMTAKRDPSTVVATMQDGAYDYLAKPLDRTKVAASVRNAVDTHRLQTQVQQLQRDAESDAFAGILGRSNVMRGLFRQLDRVAASDITVLIQGESGTGKELVAHAIHDHSARSDGPLIEVNCAAIPQSLQDAELFGHEKGAFTGADHSRPGRFEQADGGTLFLDEVAELSPELQAKLLRVLQERRFERVGGTKTLSTDFRLVAATHRDLAKMVEAGEFRQDLFFRLAVLELCVPPLRDRAGDVELLTAQFLQALATEAGCTPPRLSPAVEAVFRSYAWPGNVRELRNTLQRGMVVCEGDTIELADLPPRVHAGGALPDPVPPAEPSETAAVAAQGGSLADIERAAIEEALRATGGNLSEVTRRLGIGRATLYRRLKKYGLR